MKKITARDVEFPTRKSSSHKGENGRLLLVGGSETYGGAVLLSALGALRTGIDVAYVGAPERIAYLAHQYCPDIISIKLKGKNLRGTHRVQLRSVLTKVDALVFGNGVGMQNNTLRLMQFLSVLQLPKVIDADALKMVTLSKIKNAILTPHHQELEILLQHSDIRSISFSKERVLGTKQLTKLQQHLGNNVLIIKGKVDYVLSRDALFYNTTGNPGMTKAGTGDVLAGVCGGFLAQGESLLQSAINAVYITGLAGDRLLKRKGYGYLASELAQDIKETKRILRIQH